MRVFYMLIRMLVLTAIGIVAWQNRATITIQDLDHSLACPLALLISIVYVLGMVSGSTVVGFQRRSVQRVSGRAG